MASTWPDLHSGTNFNYIWDPIGLVWAKEVQAGGGAAGLGDASAANQTTQIARADTANTSLASILTELQLKADLTETQPVSAASLPLPTGAATEASLLLALTTANFQARINTFGQKTMAASTPVVLASDQASIPVVASAGTNLNTSALNLEATQLLIKAKTDNIPAQGQALAGASLPVVLPAAQITTLTPPAAIAGFALETSQLLGNASVSSLDGKTPTVGQKTMAASRPVVIASDQGAIPITGSISANSSADVLLPDGTPPYVAGDLAKNLTQTTDGRLRVAIAALVADAVDSYTTGDIRSLSLSSEGRLRVVTANESYNFTSWGEPGFSADDVQLDAHPLCAW